MQTFDVGAPQEVAHRTRVIHFDAFTDQRPTLGEVLGRASHFEIVDIADQEGLQPKVDLARSPVRDRLEALLAKVFVAMLLPLAPRVRMAREGVD